MLTIFIHNKRPTVQIVQWFLDIKSSLVWAHGPIVEMSAEEFRKKGFAFVRNHFKQHANTRIAEKDVQFNCTPKEAKLLMDDSDVVNIGKHGNQWHLNPEVVRRNSFPRGLETLEPEKRRTIPSNSSKEVFWKTFDEVYSFTHWYSI